MYRADNYMYIRLAPHTRALLFAFLWVVPCACNPTPEIQEVELTATPPLDHIIFRGSRIVVYPARDATWKTLIKLDIFEGFRPGMTFDDAEKYAGSPNKTGAGPSGPYYRYDRQKGTITVAHEEQKSGSDSYTAWRLHARPYEGEISAFFCPELTDHIKKRLTADETTLVIMNVQHTRPTLEVLIQDRKITRLTWLTSS